MCPAASALWLAPRSSYSAREGHERKSRQIAFVQDEVVSATNRTLPMAQSRGGRCQQAQSVVGSIGLTLFERAFDLRHSVGHAGKAENRRALHARANAYSAAASSTARMP